MKILFALLVIFLFTVQAFAQDEPEGTVTAAGMTSLGNGLWRHPSGATYTRFLATSPGRWVNGCYVAGSSYWQYRQVQVQQQIIQQKTIVQAPPKDWRNQIIELYAAQLENQQFQEALSALGLNTPSYATQRLYPNGYTMTGNIVNYGATGSSVYGYPQGVNSLQQYSTGLDLNVLFQQVASLTQQQQALGGRANESLQTLVGNQANNQAKIAEIFVQGQVAVEMLKTLRQPSVIQQGFQFKIEPNNVIKIDNSKVPQTDKDVLLQKWGNLATECATCHYEGNKKGGFDVSTYPSMSQGQRSKVIARLISTDPEKRMPRKGTPESSTPGVPYTQDQVQIWMLCPNVEVK